MSLGHLKLFFIVLIFCFSVFAEPIQKKTASLKLLDKTSNKIMEKKIDINTSISWGSLYIQIFSCYSSPPDEIPENYVLIEVVDKLNHEKEYIFRGWMISSSPDVTPLEHAIYDLWLDACINESTS